jgi:hypothetical protein
MQTKSTNTDVRNEVKFVAKANNTVRFSAPDRSVPAPAPRPAVDDDDAQWVTERMFDHYNG